MENNVRLKTRISRIFRSSLSACRARHLFDVVENAVLIPDDRPQIADQPPGSNGNGLPSMCKPKYFCNEAANLAIIHSSIIPRRHLYSFTKEEIADSARCVSMNHGAVNTEGTSFAVGCRSYKKGKKKKNRERKSGRHHARNREVAALSRSCSQDSSYYYNWFSSEDDDEEDEMEEGEDGNSVFFSSRSNTNTLSSDSSGVTASKRQISARKKTSKSASASSTSTISNDCGKVEADGGHVNVTPGKNRRPCIEDSFAVVKTSKDPYTDFRTSMVEMIIEKQIFGADDLENLLQCFLFLNSEHHHKIIVDVFAEIWTALFSC